MGAVVHDSAVAPACHAVRHLNNVSAAGAAAHDRTSALTADDHREPRLDHAPDRLRRVRAARHQQLCRLSMPFT